MDTKKKIGEITGNYEPVRNYQINSMTQIQWPSLPYNDWKETYETIHMWLQIAGKIKLKLNPFINQWWHVAFLINTSGLTTGPIPYKNIVFEINFDFIEHSLFIRTSQGQLITIPLQPMSVADFYRKLMTTLQSLEINIKINTLPSEVPDPVPFESDKEKKYYDKEYVTRWFKIMVQLWPVFERYRSTFRGKSSPIHFYWGSFDLNITRFQGNLCPPPETKDRIMLLSENEENFSCGFWPGNRGYQAPAFYSYIYPSPEQIEKVKIKPKPALYDNNLGEFILPYDEVRNSNSPEKLIDEFLQSTYHESARLAGWDIKSLRCRVPL